jgi:hypothetical protein
LPPRTSTISDGVARTLENADERPKNVVRPVIKADQRF